MSSVRKKKKLKLKKGVYVFLIILVLLGVGLYFGNKYYQNYLYKQTDEYKLLEKGYSNEETSLILKQNNNELTQELLAKNYDALTIKLLNEKYFLIKNYKDYITYFYENEEKELKDVIAIVNTHANHKWYEEEYDTQISQNELMLVNKFYKLNKDYEPVDLQNIGLSYAYGKEGENKLIGYAYEAFLQMHEDAKQKGHILMVNSSYRTYEEQEQIYNSKAKALGERKADETAAHPGHSEHQTGLVVDMTSKDAPSSKDFVNSETYKWLQENAYKYGFIERYPQDKTYITGYSPESWHWRYVGTKAAKIIHEENITFDEYYAYYVEANN